jgi:hypothetical protein
MNSENTVSHLADVRNNSVIVVARRLEVSSNAVSKCSMIGAQCNIFVGEGIWLWYSPEAERQLKLPHNKCGLGLVHTCNF